MVGTPTATQLNNVKQDLVQWDADAHRTTNVNSSGELLGNISDSGNSSTTPLAGDTGGADHIFTGTIIDTKNFVEVIVTVISDVASATNGLEIQFSRDTTPSNFTTTSDYTIPAGTEKTFTNQPERRYCRIKYTNGVAAQSSFDLEVQIKTTPTKHSSHKIQDSISSDDDAQLIKAVLTGKDPNDIFRNVSTTPDGDLTISDNSAGLAIAQSKVTGTSFIHKFGAASDFDVSDGFVTVWDGAEDDETYEKMVYTYSTSADIDTLSSDDAGNTQELEVQGLDANYDLIVQTKTLAGLAKVVLDTPLIRVFRLKNVNSSNITGHAFISVDGTLTSGVPTPNNVRAIIHGENNQTEMAVFTVPAGKTGYMRDWYASTAGAKRDSSHTIRIIARPFGQVFQLKHTANIDVNGTSYIKHDYTEPEKFTEKTDIEIRVNTNQDIAGVAAGFDIVLVDN